MRKQMILMSALTLLSLSSIEVMAQGNGGDTAAATASVSMPASPHAQLIGITAGTTGIGIQGIYPLNEKFSLRGGASYIPTFTLSGKTYLGSTYVEQKYKCSGLDFHLLVDYYLPFMRNAGFHLTGGAAWFVHAKADVTTAPYGDIYYGDIQINDERMGSVKSEVNKKGIAPYLGIGFLNLINNKHFNLTFDLGSYYLIPDGSVKMTATGYLVGNESNAKQLQENLKGYRWAPVAQFGLFYKLN